MNAMTRSETQSAGQWSRVAWLPIFLLLAGIIVARVAGLRESYRSETLTLVLSFIFYTLVSLGTLFLIGRSFLGSGSPGLLLLECGVVLWSLAGTVGDFVSHGDANINVTIFNIGILLAGVCHLAGAILALNPQRVFSRKAVWLGAGCALALGALWLVSQAALLGWLPVFFVPSHGGTLVRYAVLISAIAMFVVSAGVLHANRRATRLPFTFWYELALVLLAVGLLGIMIQLSLGSVVNWLSRTAQWLGGLYLLFAALASLRESHLPLFPVEEKSHPAYYRDAVAVAVVFAAAAVRLAFLSAMGTHSPYVVFFPAVMFAAMYGGLRPCLLATALSAILTDYFWIEPVNQFKIERLSNQLSIVIFLLSGAMIAWFADSMHRARARAAAAETQALLAAEREKTAEASEKEFRRQNRIEEAINRIFEKALTCDTEEELGRMCLTVVEELTNSKFGFIGEIGQDGWLHDIAISDPGWELCSMYDQTGHRRPPGDFKIHGLYGRVLLDGRSLLVNDPSSHPDSIGVPEGHPQLTAFLGSPFIQSGTTVGMVALGNREGGYSEEQQRDLEAVASAIFQALMRKRAEEALRRARDELETRVQERTSELSEVVERLRVENIERNQLEDTLRESEYQVRFFASECLTAQETERKRVAGELHDSIAASLGAMRFRIEKIAEEMKQGNSSPESLHDLALRVTDINNEVRRITADLRPSILDDLGIIAAMNWFCREYQKTYSHISVEKQIDLSEDEVPDSLKTPIFRISQEAMNNVSKYSKAALVNLSLRKEDDKILLTIRDNGHGFDLGTTKRGMGLSTMRERAQLSGGSFSLESAIGKGAIVRVSWALK